MAAFLSYVVAGGAKIWEELTEPVGSNTGQMSRTGRTYTRAFRIANADTDAFEAECFPDAYPWVGRHPKYFEQFVTNIEIGHMPGAQFIESDGVLEPDYFLYTVNYAPLETNGDDGSEDPNGEVNDLLIGSVSHSMEAMTLPGYGLQWHGLTSGEEKVKEDISPYLMIPITNYSITKPRQRSIPWGVIKFCTGRVNASTFWGFDAETVLYTGASVAYRFSSDGSRQYDVDHQFSVRQIVYSDSNIDNAVPGSSVPDTELRLTSEALWKNETGSAKIVPSPAGYNNMLATGFTDVSATGGVQVYGWNHQWNATKRGFYKIKYAKTDPDDPDRFMYQSIDAFPALLQ